MVLTEALMLTLILSVCLYVTVTDMKTGLIPNKALASAAAAALILDGIYYIMFARDLFGGFLINLAVSVLFSLLLYGFHFWGAGDSKLLILIVMTIPARFYANSLLEFPTLSITVFTFAIAFVYLIIESVVLGIIHKNFFDTGRKLTLSGAVGIIKNYIISYIYIIGFSFAERFLLSEHFSRAGYLIPLLNFFIIFTVISLDLFRKWYVILSVTAADAAVFIFFIKGSALYLPPAWNIAVIALVILFRSLAEKYNYKTIPTSEIKAGTVLSLSAVMLFKASRVKGLPQSTTEDFRSRITADEAESIKRWENSKNGKPEIVIVRKLPFAIFIFIGTIAFLALRRWLE